MNGKLTPEEEASMRAEVQTLLKRLAEHGRIVHEEARSAGQLYTLHYWAHMQQYEEETLTLEEAVSYAEGGEEAGSLSADYIVGPRGERYTPKGVPADA